MAIGLRKLAYAGAAPVWPGRGRTPAWLQGSRIPPVLRTKSYSVCRSPPAKRRLCQMEQSNAKMLSFGRRTDARAYVVAFSPKKRPRNSVHHRAVDVGRSSRGTSPLWGGGNGTGGDTLYSVF